MLDGGGGGGGDGDRQVSNIKSTTPRMKAFSLEGPLNFDFDALGKMLKHI